MFYNEYGEENGTKIILLHGGTGTGESHWKGQIKPLTERGYHVFVPDLPGHGESLLDDPEVYNRDILIAAVRKLLEEQGPMICVGFSMGGHTLLGMLQDDDTHSLLKGLVLVGTSIDENSYLEKWRSYFDPDDFAKRNPLFIRGLSRRHKAQGGEDAWKKVFVRDSSGELEVKVDIELFKGLDVPIMLVRGDRDQAVDPTHFDLLRGIWSHADLAIIPRSGHDVAMTRPELFNAVLIDFLDRNKEAFS